MWEKVGIAIRLPGAKYPTLMYGWHYGTFEEAREKLLSDESVKSCAINNDVILLSSSSSEDPSFYIEKWEIL